MPLDIIENLYLAYFSENLNDTKKNTPHMTKNYMQ
jgi:hypothetical protein